MGRLRLLVIVSLTLCLRLTSVSQTQPSRPQETKGATIQGYLFDAVTAGKINGMVVLLDLSRRPLKQASMVGKDSEHRITEPLDNVPANALVALVPPTEFRNEPGVSKTAGTDKNGHFAIRGIRPGIYTVYAFPKIENNAWLNDDFMSAYRALGIQINFGKGTLVYRDLKSIPMPK